MNFHSLTAIAGLFLVSSFSVLAADTILPPALLALQPQATISRASTPDGAVIELADLNPTVGRWLLLRLPGPDHTQHWAHLDLGQEGLARAKLDSEANLRIEFSGGKSTVCTLGSPASRELYAKNYRVPFTALCDGAVFVRSKPAKGYKSDLESVTDWLREQGPMGEQLINWRKDLFPGHGDSATPGEGAAAAALAPGGPMNAIMIAKSPSTLSTANLGLITGVRSIAPGAWAPVQGAPGVWTSIAAPSFAAPQSLDHKGSDALAYFMAIETSQHDPRYSVGVEHPNVIWSTRAPLPALPVDGPDGFANLDPLDRVGMVPPWAMNRLTAVITGGFKREHSAFNAGPLSTKNHGSHYGFAEAGIVMSSLQPGLATFFQRVGEKPQLKVWGPEDEVRGVDKLIFARQNGLPLIEDFKQGKDLTIGFGANWSGNQAGSPDTIRSALCLAENGKRSFVIYGVFTKAVPKDMGQLLAAYNCKSAMQLDMNAPSLTYAAVVGKDENGQTRYMPLMVSMDDRNFGGTARFTNLPDSRDFFYFVRR